MEGDIERVKEQYCVRRGKSEVWIAADKAVRLCADWDDAYAFAQSLLKSDTATNRMHLARWCHMHRMVDRALEQAQRALDMEPNNVEAKQLVAQLERMAKAPPPSPVAAVVIPTPPTKAPEPAPNVDVSFETVVAFTTRVQPILMNTCANCHATGHGGKFHLERVGETNKKALSQRNLAAVLDQIDLERPAISPLLVRAITPHGDAHAPAIKDRGALPFQAVQQWIEQTIAKNPQLKDYHAARKPAPVKTPGDSNFAVPPGKEPKTPIAIPTPVSRGVAQEEPVASKVAAPVGPVDMYDPAIFNRAFHPHR
jgi:hypothetical protein